MKNEDLTVQMPHVAERDLLGVGSSSRLRGYCGYAQFLLAIAILVLSLQPSCPGEAEHSDTRTQTK